MPKFAETTSKEQRAAVVAAALALGNRKEATRRANAGTLQPGMEAFEISYTYVCELVQAEEARRDPAGVAARGRSAAELADDILRRELRRLDAQSRGNRLDPVKAREKLRALRELDAIAKRTTSPTRDPEPGSDGGEDQAPEPVGILERLAIEEEAAMRAEPSDAGSSSTQHAGNDAGSAAGSEPVTRPDDDEHASAVRARAENLAQLAAGV